MAKWELKWSEKPPAKGKKAAAAAFQKTCQELDPKFDDAFNAKVWDWSSGEPRDIVDTGALRDSKTGPNFSKGYGKSGQTVKWDWTESYASYVYVGGRKGGRTMPGRPWAGLTAARRCPWRGFNPTSGGSGRCGPTARPRARLTSGPLLCSASCRRRSRRRSRRCGARVRLERTPICHHSCTGNVRIAAQPATRATGRLLCTGSMASEPRWRVVGERPL